MASEQILKELFQVAKGSTSFKGMSDDDIWNACKNYSDRPDSDIQIAMENIKKKDDEAVEKSEKQKESLQQGREKMTVLHEQEVSEREKDSQSAEEVLANLFDV